MAVSHVFTYILPPPRKTKNAPRFHRSRERQTKLAFPLTHGGHTLSPAMNTWSLCFPGQGLPPAFDNIVTDSVYITYILPRNFSGSFYAHPCHRNKMWGFGRFPRNNFWKPYSERNPTIAKLSWSVMRMYYKTLPKIILSFMWVWIKHRQYHQKSQIESHLR